MGSVAFGDESSIHAGKAQCYGIGCFVLRYADLLDVIEELKRIYSHRGLAYELKWNRVRDYRPIVEASIDAIRFLLSSGAMWQSIVVHKRSYVKWSTNAEEAFYRTYQYVAREVCKAAGEPVDLMIDNRSDRYPKRAEALQIITNHALAKIGSSGYVKDLKKVDSKQQPILQIADVLLGAITADTNQRLDKSYVLTPGKTEVIRRIAGLVGWDALSYDTYPNPAFNIWHFPIEFRGVFPSRDPRLSLQLA